MGWLTEHKRESAHAWYTLNISDTYDQSTWHQFGWMIVLGNGCWGQSEVAIDLKRLNSLAKKSTQVIAPVADNMARTLAQVENADAVLTLVAEGDEKYIECDKQLPSLLASKVSKFKDDIIKFLSEMPAYSEEEVMRLEQSVRDKHEKQAIYFMEQRDEWNEAARRIYADSLALIAKAKRWRDMRRVKLYCQSTIEWIDILPERLRECRREIGCAHFEED